MIVVIIVLDDAVRVRVHSALWIVASFQVSAEMKKETKIKPENINKLFGFRILQFILFQFVEQYAQ